MKISKITFIVLNLLYLTASYSIEDSSSIDHDHAHSELPDSIGSSDGTTSRDEYNDQVSGSDYDAPSYSAPTTESSSAGTQDGTSYTGKDSESAKNENENAAANDLINDDGTHRDNSDTVIKDRKEAFESM